MPVSSSCTVHKAENEHTETAVPARVTGKCKSTVTVRVLNICNITALSARALGRVVGITPTAAQLGQRAAKAGEQWEEVQERKGHGEDREGSEKWE